VGARLPSVGLPSHPPQDFLQPPSRSAARPTPPGLDVPDGLWIEPSPGGHLLLCQPQPEPSGSDPPREAVPFRNEPRSESGFDRRPAPRQGRALVPLPRCHRFRVATQPLGKGSLRQPQVHPSPANPFPERPWLMRIAPWEYTRSTPKEAEIAERQRNGAGAAGSGIRAGAAAARRPTSRSTTRASADRCWIGSISRSRCRRSRHASCTQPPPESPARPSGHACSRRGDINTREAEAPAQRSSTSRQRQAGSFNSSTSAWWETALTSRRKV